MLLAKLPQLRLVFDDPLVSFEGNQLINLVVLLLGKWQALPQLAEEEPSWIASTRSRIAGIALPLELSRVAEDSVGRLRVP